MKMGSSSVAVLLFVVIFGVLGSCEGGNLKKGLGNLKKGLGLGLGLGLGNPKQDSGNLKINFYKKTCPNVEKIVKILTTKHVISNPVLPAKLLRMQFHDCFLRGCDASILLNSTANSIAEKDSPVNTFIRGFVEIDNIKAQLEKTCPGVVSCADILALATRDSVSLQFRKPLWKVLLGRRDGTVSLASEVTANIPAPTLNFTGLQQNFANKGMSVRDLVVLSGGHTIGTGHCFLMSNRLYNFTGKGDADPLLDPTYAAFLRTKCPNNTTDTVPIVEMDPRSSRTFDTDYYRILKKNKGLFTSDAALLTNQDSTTIVDQMLKANKFFKEFGESMERLLEVGIKTGRQGEIRKVCGAINS